MDRALLAGDGGVLASGTLSPQLPAVPPAAAEPLSLMCAGLQASPGTTTERLGSLGTATDRPLQPPAAPCPEARPAAPGPRAARPLPAAAAACRGTLSAADPWRRGGPAVSATGSLPSSRPPKRPGGPRQRPRCRAGSGGSAGSAPAALRGLGAPPPPLPWPRRGSALGALGARRPSAPAGRAVCASEADLLAEAVPSPAFRGAKQQLSLPRRAVGLGRD